MCLYILASGLKKDPQIYLAHIRDEVGVIREYTEEGQEVFLKDRKTQGCGHSESRDHW